MFGSLSSTKLLRVMISFSLVFWIAGFGCIFGCESQAMAGAEAHHGTAALRATSGTSCHKAAEHSCCSKRAHSANKTPAKAGLSELLLTSARGIEMAGGMMRECPMGLNAKALGTKPRTDEAATAIAFEPIDLPLFNAVGATATTAPSFLNNRGHTYLRCCVFLI
jgi:hypothetical protein